MPLALPKSICPAYFAFSAATTLPMSFIPAALVSAIAAAEFGAAALVVQLDGFLALFDHFLEYAEEIRVGQGRLAFPARGDIGVLDGRINHAQRGKLALLLGPHRVLDGVIDVVAQHRPVLSRPMTPPSSKPLI